jgi:hypothetical protein
MTRLIARFWCALCASAIVVQFLSSTASAVDTMADWVGRNNAPGATYYFDSQVLDSTNTVGHTQDNYVVISPTSIGGTKQAKVNFNSDPNNRVNEDPLGATNVNYEHTYLADHTLDGGPFTFSNALHMDYTFQFDMPDAGAQEAGINHNFCFCWFDHTDTRHRVGLGLSNTTTTGTTGPDVGYTAQPNAVRADLFYASSAGNGNVFASKDGTLTNGANNVAGSNSLIPDGTYHVVFDYVPATDTSGTGTAGSSMSASVSNGTTTWFANLSPLPNAPWFFDGFSLDSFGVIPRSTGGTVQNGVFNFNISNVTYTGGTALPGVPGDYNNNGVVDAADYVAWRKGGSLSNEVDNPGTVNAADYTAWKARFGNTSGSGSGLGAEAVPEPTTALLASLAGLAMVASWRRYSGS